MNAKTMTALGTALCSLGAACLWLLVAIVAAKATGLF